MYYTPLPQRGLIRLDGEDAIAFLQGLISNDATLLEKGNAIYAALLSPQGKFLHDFFLIPAHDHIVIDCEKSRAEDLLARLKRYRLRSKVTLEAMEDAQGVFAVWGMPHSPVTQDARFLLIEDPRLPKLGMRLVGDHSGIHVWCRHQELEPVTPAAYDHMRLELGVPDGSRDMIVEKSLLPEFGFEQLHGVDFGKGCYVGQEVIARAKYRGQLKKGLYKIRSENALPEAGTKIMRGEMEAGEVRSSLDNIGLALLRFEEVEKSLDGQGALHVAGDIILAQRPYWFAPAE